MFRLSGCAVAMTVMFVLANRGIADDKKETIDPSRAGTWAREANGIELQIAFGPKNTLKLSVIAGDNGAIVSCKYTIGKEGEIKAEVIGVEEKGNFPSKPATGLEFSFKWKVKGDTGTLDDLKGPSLDEAKPIVEGEYDRKKEKK